MMVNKIYEFAPIGTIERDFSNLLSAYFTQDISTIEEAANDYMSVCNAKEIQEIVVAIDEFINRQDISAIEKQEFVSYQTSRICSPQNAFAFLMSVKSIFVEALNNM